MVHGREPAPPRTPRDSGGAAPLPRPPLTIAKSTMLTYHWICNLVRHLPSAQVVPQAASCASSPCPFDREARDMGRAKAKPKGRGRGRGRGVRVILCLTCRTREQCIERQSLLPSPCCPGGAKWQGISMASTPNINQTTQIQGASW